MITTDTTTAANPVNLLEEILVTSADQIDPVKYEWGAIKWLCDMKVTPGSLQSIGYAFVEPRSNQSGAPPYDLSGGHLHAPASSSSMRTVSV